MTVSSQRFAPRSLFGYHYDPELEFSVGLAVIFCLRMEAVLNCDTWPCTDGGNLLNSVSKAT